MKVVGLNNREYNLDLKKYIVLPSDTKKKSKYHLSARILLNDIFKGYSVYEEVKLPGSRTPNKQSVLFLDFFVPYFNLAVEVHGAQHYEFCRFFHKTKADFLNQVRRDEIKKEWCELNKIHLIELSYKDSEEIWREQIVNR